MLVVVPRQAGYTQGGGPPGAGFVGAGRRPRATVVPAQERLIAGQLAALAPDEQRQLLGLLRRVDRALA